MERGRLFHDAQDWRKYPFNWTVDDVEGFIKYGKLLLYLGVLINSAEGICCTSVWHDSTANCKIIQGENWTGQ